MGQSQFDGFKSYQLSASVYGAQTNVQQPPLTQPKHRMSALNSHDAPSLEGLSSLDKFSSIREVEEEQQESLVGNSQKHNRRRTGVQGSKRHHFEMDLVDL